ncbi:Rap guanine nucleotide exchange factor 1 [Halotydeus destructor]|nr:Rap guanine nucleotide exchange factor 1 [Halotydeus destructor]
MRSSRENADCIPPELPVKLRVKTNNSHSSSCSSVNSNSKFVNGGRPTSQYDNLSSTDYYYSSSSNSSFTSSQSSSFYRNSFCQEPQANHQLGRQFNYNQHNYQHQLLHREPSFPPLSRSRMISVREEDIVHNVTLRRPSNVTNDRPPPLPPKTKNIVSYIGNMSSFYGHKDAEAALNRYRGSVFANFKSTQNSAVQRLLDDSSIFVQKGFERNSNSSGSDESMLSVSSNSTPVTICLTKPVSSLRLGQVDPPVLPPKKSHSTSNHNSLYSSSNTLVRNDSLSAAQSSGPPSDSSSGISSLSGESSPKSVKSSTSPTKITEKKPVKGPLDCVDVTQWLAFKADKEDGPEIRGGTIDALIVRATEVSKNDLLFVEAFLTTYRTFITPKELIEKLIYRYYKFLKVTETRQKIAINAFALLVRVVDDLCSTDCTEELMRRLTDFVNQMVNGGNSTLARLLKDKTSEKMELRKSLSSVSQILLPSVAISTKVSRLHDFKSKELAEQMSLLDLELYNKIDISEILTWAKEQKEDLIPNLTKFTEHFNKMSFWARSRILVEEESRDRERIILKLIKIIKHLRKLKNFNSFLAIVSALDSAPVRRLEWPKTVIEEIKEHSSLIDSSSSFKAYRQVLDDSEPPCIPYIGLILQDLTFIDQGNADLLVDDKLNFDKRWKLFYRLDEMRRFKSSQYPFKKNEGILNYFNNFDDHLHEEAMWQISESIKPRTRS